jgi:hypothetical protein
MSDLYTRAAAVTQDQTAKQRAIRCLWRLVDGTVTPLQPNLYCVIDAAKDPRIYPELAAFAADYDIASLYEQPAASEFATVAPYLICLGTDLRLFDWLWQHGWGNGWGIFAWTVTSFDNVRRHFRHLAVVHTEHEAKLLFRFYDPKVVAAFLRTCDEAQLRSMFGPLSTISVETNRGCSITIFNALPTRAENIATSLALNIQTRALVVCDPERVSQ